MHILQNLLADAETTPPLMKKVVAAWEHRCKKNGHPPPPQDAWHLVALRGSGTGQRIVLRLSEPDQKPIILKARPGLRSSKFNEAIKAQTTFADLLAHAPKAHAPAIIETLPSVRAIVMEDAVGTEALRIAQKNRSTLPKVLARCAGWMDASWALRPGEDAKWRSEHARKRLAWARKKARHLRDDVAFSRLGAWCETRLEALDGQTVRLALSHGDLHLSNILLSRKNNAWGIDFETFAETPQAYDLARLIAHTATMFGPQNAVDMEAAEHTYRDHMLSGLSAERQIDTRFLDLFLAIDALVYRGDTSEHPKRDTKQRRARSKRATALVDALVLRASQT